MARCRKRRFRAGRLLFLMLVFGGIFSLIFLAGIRMLHMVHQEPVASQPAEDSTSSSHPLDHSKQVEQARQAAALDKISTAGFSDVEIRSLFFSAPLNTYQINKITGSTFFAGQDFITIDDLRYVKVLYVDFKGDTRIGELIVNEEVCSDLEEIFYDLYLHQYPIGKMALADTYSGSENQNMEANNTFALLFSQSYAMEQDAFNSGYAIHLNPLYNPKVTESFGRMVVTPATSYPYANRHNLKNYMITRDDYAYQAFIKKGFKWAGSDDKTQNYGVFWKSYPKKHEASAQTEPSYDWNTGEVIEQEDQGPVIGYDVYGNPIYESDQTESTEDEKPVLGYDIYGNPIYEQEVLDEPAKSQGAVLGYDAYGNPIYEMDQQDLSSSQNSMTGY